ncbi:unnamed protein product [Linum trigynum]|uniref:Uncharacterized protein n=1 Tax=Linum trigynum TaxID=586398 RepID=A0AAV2E9D8_9ROSI
MRQNNRGIGVTPAAPPAAAGGGQESEKKKMNRLHELEKHLLDDDDDEEGSGGDTVFVITNTNSNWSETIQNLISACFWMRLQIIRELINYGALINE